MNYYQFVFTQLPQIKFAHRHETTNYDIHFLSNPHEKEISFIEIGDVITEYSDGTSVLLKAPYICTSLFDQPRHCYSKAPLHRHFTVGIHSDVKVLKISEIDIADYWKQSVTSRDSHTFTAFLPEFSSDSKLIDKLEPLIKKIILENSRNTPEGQLHSLSLLFELFSITTEYCTSQSMQHYNAEYSPANASYCTKVAGYISRHLHEKIYVADIADSLRMSSGHISRLFKETTGYSIIEYSNLMKINHAKKLLETDNFSACDAARQIGIDDEKYFCRLFKKYTGMTTTEYKTTRKTTAL